jgi:hypothetical protein
MNTIDPSQLALVIGGNNEQSALAQLGHACAVAAIPSAAAGFTNGAIYGAVSGGPAGALSGAGIGLVAGAVSGCAVGAAAAAVDRWVPPPR